MKKRLARVLLKLARRLDPPPQFTGKVNHDISVSIIRAEEQAVKALRDHQRAQARLAGLRAR